MALILGKSPDGLSIILTPGFAFTATIRAMKNGDSWNWPTGSVLTLVISDDDGEKRVDGVVDGPNVTWSLTEQEVAEVENMTKAHIIIAYPELRPFCWAKGSVSKRD